MIMNGAYPPKTGVRNDDSSLYMINEWEIQSAHWHCECRTVPSVTPNKTGDLVISFYKTRCCLKRIKFNVVLPKIKISAMTKNRGDQNPDAALCICIIIFSPFIGQPHMSPHLRRFGIYCLLVCQFKEGYIWVLIASSPELCIRFTFLYFTSLYLNLHWCI